MAFPGSPSRCDGDDPAETLEGVVQWSLSTDEAQCSRYAGTLPRLEQCNWRFPALDHA